MASSAPPTSSRSEGRASRVARTLTLASQLANVWLFDGSPDETVSGRAWREGVLDPVWARRRRRIDALFRALFGERDHCRAAHEADRAFARLILGLPDPS
ncbi:MAG TPA: hypothetical protein VM434_05050 [Beijerinckiaceae bacterium]|nr:hypothetical protein [Beijerinckiaceae bacterium]